MRNCVSGLGLVLAMILGGMVIGASNANATEEKFEKILDAIEQVESSGQGADTPDGDGGKAIGPFQIHLAYWRDAIAYDSSLSSECYEACRDPDYARRVVRAYLRRYAGRSLDNAEVLARVHNGGGGIMRKSRDGRAWRLTTLYWEKVRRELEK